MGRDRTRRAHLRAGNHAHLEEIRHFAGRHLVRYKLPTRVVPVEQLPRNASGKLAKVELRRLVEAEQNTGTAWAPPCPPSVRYRHPRA